MTLKPGDIVLVTVSGTTMEFAIKRIVNSRIRVQNLDTGKTIWTDVCILQASNPVRTGRQYSFLGFTFNLYYHEEELNA